jgi:hypothetical protein
VRPQTRSSKAAGQQPSLSLVSPCKSLLTRPAPNLQAAMTATPKMDSSQCCQSCWTAALSDGQPLQGSWSMHLSASSLPKDSMHTSSRLGQLLQLLKGTASAGQPSSMPPAAAPILTSPHGQLLQGSWSMHLSASSLPKDSKLSLDRKAAWAAPFPKLAARTKERKWESLFQKKNKKENTSICKGGEAPGRAVDSRLLEENSSTIFPTVFRWTGRGWTTFQLQILKGPPCVAKALPRVLINPIQVSMA